MCGLQESNVVEEATYIRNSRIISYILNILIYVGLILLDNLLQYVMFIVVMDLLRNCGNTIVLICNLLVMFMSYFWIKIKVKMLILPTLSSRALKKL
jgi:hypothetical protein